MFEVTEWLPHAPSLSFPIWSFAVPLRNLFRVQAHMAVSQIQSHRASSEFLSVIEVRLIEWLISTAGASAICLWHVAP